MREALNVMPLARRHLQRHGLQPQRGEVVRLRPAPMLEASDGPAR